MQCAIPLLATATIQEVLLLPGERNDTSTNRLVDRYSRRDGRYIGSYALRTPVRDVAANDNTVFVLTGGALLRISPTVKGRDGAAAQP